MTSLHGPIKLQEELKGHGKLLGYRAMQKRLQLTYGLVVRR